MRSPSIELQASLRMHRSRDEGLILQKSRFFLYIVTSARIKKVCETSPQSIASSRLHVVAHFPVEFLVKPCHFLVIVHSEAHHFIQTPSQNIGHDIGIECDHNDGDRLHPDLSRVATDETLAAHAGKKTGGERAPDTTQAMDSHHIQGVVIAQFEFEPDAVKTEDPQPNR